MRYLIVGPSWVGDMVMAQSLFKALVAIEKPTELAVLAPAATYPLLERMPEVSEAILSPIAHGELNLRAHRKMGKQLRDRFDSSIILPGSLKSALIPYFARVPKRTGWKAEMRFILLNDIRQRDKQLTPLMVRQYLELAVARGAPVPETKYPALQVDEGNLKTLREKFSLKTDRKILALCPGAEFGPAKQWPAEHFAELAREKISEGWYVHIFGGPKDLDAAQSIEKQLNNPACFNLAGKTRLLDAVDLLSLADTVVSNDSGLMHVSAALGRKLVVLYGSSSPAFTPPLSDRAEILSLNLDCSPCFERECPLGHLNCLNMLKPSLVSERIERLQTS